MSTLLQTVLCSLIITFAELGAAHALDSRAADPDDDLFCAQAQTQITGLSAVLSGIGLDDAVAKYTHYEAQKDYVGGGHDIKRSEVLAGANSRCTLIRLQINVPVLSDEVADLWHKMVKKSADQLVIYYRSAKGTTHSSCTAGKVTFTQTADGTRMEQEIRVGTSFSSKARQAAQDTFNQMLRALVSGTSTEELRVFHARMENDSACAQYGSPTVRPRN